MFCLSRLPFSIFIFPGIHSNRQSNGAHPFPFITFHLNTFRTIWVNVSSKINKIYKKHVVVMGTFTAEKITGEMFRLI